MAIFLDSVGNHYMGDCIYGNNNINFSSYNYLVAEPHETVVTNIQSLLSNAGMNYRNIISQSTFNNTQRYKVILNVATASDTIDDRYTFGYSEFLTSGFHTTTNFAGSTNLSLFDDGGHTSVTEDYNNFNILSRFNYNLPPGARESIVNINAARAYAFYDYIGNPDSDYSKVHWSGVSDGESVGFFITQSHFPTDTRINLFAYMGIVDDVNTNENYYSANVVSKSIMLMALNGSKTSYNTTSPVRGTHYIGGTAKILLYTGEALYPIVCNDAQTPTSQWATDFYVLDNDAAKGYPTLGRVRNMLLAQGVYTIGKPVKILGSVFPDAGHNHWLPVGQLGSYTLLLRCYSSVV